MLPAQSTCEKAEKRNCFQHREDMPLLFPVVPPKAVAEVSKIGNL
jgi:hypothetical protein